MKIKMGAQIALRRRLKAVASFFNSRKRKSIIVLRGRDKQRRPAVGSTISERMVVRVARGGR
jgi:hypothetical protein